jgi:hypothetical protein
LNWLRPVTKIGSNVQGATESGDELWFAWSAGKDVSVGGGATETVWPQPHVEIAVVGASSLKLDRMDYLWSEDRAYAWPALATNVDGDVGIALTWGGGGLYPTPAVGFLTGTRSLVGAIPDPTFERGSGGHYLGIRPHFPIGRCFSAAVFDQMPLGVTNRPHYLLFGRAGQTCDLPPPPAPKAPVVTTGAADAVGSTSATITGTINPTGSDATWYFQWGPTTAYGTKTTAHDAGSGTDDTSVAELLTGLAPGTTYHYQLVGTNTGGTVSGADQSFTTPSPPPPPPPAAKLPDLVISQLAKDSFTVKNQGEAAAEAFVVTLTNSNVGAASYSFAGLAAGASATQTFFCHSGRDTAVADAGGAVAESNETNNSATLDVVSCIG